MATATPSSESTPRILRPNIDVVRATLDFYHPRDCGGLYEIRLRDCGRYRTVSGVFEAKDNERAAVDAANWAAKQEAVATYLTLNRVKPECYARRGHAELMPYAKATTTDLQIAERVNLLFDFDAERLSEIAATDAEKELAERCMWELLDFLYSAARFPVPGCLIGDSGNGYAASFALAVPNTEETDRAIKALLDALARTFGGNGVKFDTSVANRAQLTRLLGTPNRKGANVDDRPWRLARIIMPGDREQPVTLDQIHAAIDKLPPAPDPAKRTASKLDSTATLEEAGEALESVDADDRVVWLRMGMALKSEFGEAGRSVWDTYSRRSSKFDEIRPGGHLRATAKRLSERSFGRRDRPAGSRDEQRRIKPRRNRALQIAVHVAS